MSTAAQVVVVIVTIAMVLLAGWAIAWMRRMDALAADVRTTLAKLGRSVDDAHGRVGEAMSLLDDLRTRAKSLTATAAGVEHAGGRAAGMLSTVLGGFEGPVREAIGVARGIRAGMRYLKEGRSDEHVGFEPSRHG